MDQLNNIYSMIIIISWYKLSWIDQLPQKIKISTCNTGITVPCAIVQAIVLYIYNIILLTVGVGLA